VVRLDGAVESAIRLGVADVVADVVSSGTTLRAAGLEVFGPPVLTSEAVLIRRETLGEEAREGFAVLVRRVEGVLTAQRYVLMDYDVPIGAVERAVSITPGLESPTVSPLHDHQWVAVRAMVPRADTNALMDRLYEVGARAILTTEIHACRI
jgi:ATP phosphoribosyltransferase